MEEPIPHGEIPGTKDPIKAEPTAHASPEDRGGANSPTPECSICLGHLVNTSFTDSCLHQFCFTCLLQWSKIKTECPLCKQTFKSIIHNVRSEEDYDQYHVPREMVGPPQISPLVDINLELINLDYDFIRHVQDPVARRFAYRTTITPNRRFRLLSNSTQTQAGATGDGVSTVSREEQRYRRRNPSEYRRNVYRHGEWSAPLPGHYAGALEHSAGFFRTNPYELNRLIPWINRDLQILLNGNEPHIAYVLRTIMDSLTRHDLRSAELRDVLRPHFGIHTDHFLHELMNYARTGFEIAAYDNYITYPTHGLPSGYMNSVQSPTQTSSSSSSSSSDDSDVRVVDHVDVQQVEMPAIGPHPIDVPGPSTVSQTLQICPPTASPTIFTISSESEESDCEVVGYVKPRHERTPEIIEIASSDGEMAGPSTSVPLGFMPHSPSLTFIPQDEPSTSQEIIRRNPRGTRRKASMHIVPIDCEFSDSVSEDDKIEGVKKPPTMKHTRKASKTCKKSPRKQSHKKIFQNSKKRTRKTSSSDDDSLQDSKKRKTKRSQKFRSRTVSHSSSEEDSQAHPTNKKALIIKIRKDLTKQSQSQNDRHTEDSSSSSTNSSSSSYFSESDFSSNTSDTNLPLKKRKCERGRRRTAHFRDKDRRSRGKMKSTVIKCVPVDSTILRKDATKKEWYVDKKVDRSPSKSCNEDKQDTRLRISISEYRERKVMEMSSTESPGDGERRSNSQCSSRSARIQGKYRKHKSKRKECGRSLEESVEKLSSEAKNTNKRKKTHKKYKSLKGKHSKVKNKSGKRSWGSSGYSGTSSD
ncbi:E3 ubiquitin-protein ligase Topors [Fopius arisanus]|uniref:E3 ubiquitin-protein ligase Topors n=2 Tax=Fopius arisanus TaxID=64838 RepID=A0A0C9QRK3_9HYME|nr:PREDICTED: E3 ubiquitin-protein ligase Topors [Fopius arisanus]XP_011313103.1 PREDICTED: E3 ubiquitin-protein ligase Topors [Fopius arisanus]XP_011313104.1 PREDICTED: E3 ubiquitin-protein ligase Topors [Fopius arisanus]XP_011313105.1 PREDICTED: E3 ubiquitin-protein ligase Topors [Fopius arisanus]